MFNLLIKQRVTTFEAIGILKWKKMKQREENSPRKEMRNETNKNDKVQFSFINLDSISYKYSNSG